MYKGSVAPSSTIFNYPIPSRPFEIVSFDTLGPFILSATHKYKYILVFSCHLTRYCEIVGVTDRTAENVAFAIRDRVIKSHGTPRTFMSDSAAEFCSAIIKQLCKDYDINRVNITVRYPAANGLVERTNGKVLALLRTVVNAHQDNWDDCLPEVQSAINSAYNVSVGDTPHFLLYGYDKILPYDLVVPSDSEKSVEMHEYVRENMQRRKAVLEISSSRLRTSKEMHGYARKNMRRKEDAKNTEESYRKQSAEVRYLERGFVVFSLDM